MREKKKTQQTNRKQRTSVSTRRISRNTAAWILGSGVALSAAVGIFVSQTTAGSEVYAADEVQQGDRIPSGFAGVLAGISETPAPGSRIERIGTSAENVMVGQRVSTVENPTVGIDISASVESQVNHLDEQAAALSVSAKMMSDEDYNVLLRIVEAEAGEDDVKARVLVANVIMNRVKRADFPDTVTDVVFQYVNGVPQFSPTYDGKIYTVTVTDETREAVRQALEGTDYSEGALFFIQKEAAESSGISWFETDLKRLFKYGVHEFYTYSDAVDMQEPEEEAPVQTVEMQSDEVSVASAKEE